MHVCVGSPTLKGDALPARRPWRCPICHGSGAVPMRAEKGDWIIRGIKADGDNVRPATDEEVALWELKSELEERLRQNAAVQEQYRSCVNDIEIGMDYDDVDLGVLQQRIDDCRTEIEEILAANRGGS